jgi:hypothetical protein
MSITISDPALLAQIRQASGVVDVKDPSGKLLGAFIAEGYGKLPSGVQSPISKEEFEQARGQQGGRPLGDILKDLEARHGARS